jgi:hypothetical protein
VIRVTDRVRLVAPAGPLPPDQLTAGVAALAGWGLRVSASPDRSAGPRPPTGVDERRVRRGQGEEPNNS